MKQCTIIFLFVIVFNSITAQIPNQRVVITGTIINSTVTTPKVIGFDFCNPFNKNRKSAVTDSMMTFFAEEYTPFAHNMTVIYNRNYINLYITPGDSVNLQIDAAMLDQPDFKWLRISGDHAAISTQLNLLHHAISQLPSYQYNYAVSATQMLADVKKDYSRYLDFLDGYSHTHHTDQSVLDFFKRDIKYGISNSIVDYVTKGKDSVSPRAERIAAFSDPFFDYTNDSNFVSMMYPYHLQYYQAWKIEEDKTTASIKQRQDRALLKSGVKVLLKEPASISRDYMLYYNLSSWLDKNPALQGEIPALKRYFTNPVFYNSLKELTGANKHFAVKKTVVSEIRYMENDRVLSLPNVDILEMFSKKYPGKVIYLDIYATWCAPCLKEMEYTPSLHQKFKGKNVAFVNLCLESSEQNWIKLIQQQKVHGENYFLNDDNGRLLRGNFNVTGFPTYLLIDRTGKLKSKVPRPSEIYKSAQEINDLLDK